MKTFVVIPTYNEKPNIKPLVKSIKLHLPPANILFVDDNSPDGTQLAIKRLQRSDQNIHLLPRVGKQGLGPAYRAGFRQALNIGADVIVQMDADLSHNPKDLPKLVTNLKINDLVIGSRYIKGGGVSNWDPFRVFISQSASLYARLILDLPIHDLTGGFKAWQAPALKKLLSQNPNSNGYVWQIEMNYLAYKNDLLIREVPIVFKERERGKSKMDWQVAREAIFKVWQLRFNDN